MSGRQHVFRAPLQHLTRYAKASLIALNTALLLLMLSPVQAAEVVDPTTPVTQTAANTLISLNQATLEQLQQINGIGPAKAEAIVRYREEQGAFNSLDALQQVPGIGPTLLERMRPYLTL